jgi:aspartate/methionine/tyrosine aminotransferase
MTTIAALVSKQPSPHIASMNKRSEELTNLGRSVLKLSGGDPKHYPAVLLAILQELGERTDVGRMLNYSPIAGFADLRRKIVELVNVRYNRSPGVEQVLVCSGGCSGLFLALKTMINPGDAILITDPCWEYLPRLAEHCGGVARVLDAFACNRTVGAWQTFIESVERSLCESGARVVVINSPLNPTGAVVPVCVIADLAKLCERHGAWLLLDEVTVDFQYLDEPLDFGTLDSFQNVVAVHSFSKNFGLTGFRLGYVLAAEEFCAQLRKTQLYTFMYPSSLAQEVVFRYLSRGPGEYLPFLNRTVAELRSRAVRFSSLLSDISGVTVRPPDGGLFLFPKLAANRAIDWVAALEQHGVAVAPGEAFGRNGAGHVRLFVGIDYHEMVRAAEFLNAVIRSN